MLLTDEERARFCAYLQTEVDSYEQLAEQSAKLPGCEFLVKRCKLIHAAASVMLHQLQDSEQVVVAGEE